MARPDSSQQVRQLARLLRGRGSSSLLVVLGLIALIAFRLFETPPVDPRELFESDGPFRVKRVVDGDTLLLEGGHRVRLFGVDTPETKKPNTPPEPFGHEASEFTRKHVEGKMVRLEYDRERRDQYGRILAYVYVGEWFLNEELIRVGLSEAETHFAYSEAMKRRFRAVEAEAREKKVGIWGGGR